MTPRLPLINISDIVVQRDLTMILNRLSWRVNPGEHWVIFGPNGAGKTSLLNVVQGYLWPTTGRVQVCGGTLGDGVDVRELRAGMPVVSESVKKLIYEGLTGLEVLVTGMRAHLNIFADPTAEEINRAREIAEETRIVPLLTKSFSIMSTGERQRMLIARALLADPQMIILDEPCSGLDLAGREWVLHMMESILARDSGPALLLTTHHVEEIPAGFTHVLLLKGGEKFAAGPIDEIFTSGNLSKQFDIPLQIETYNGRWSARALSATAGVTP